MKPSFSNSHDDKAKLLHMMMAGEMKLHESELGMIHGKTELIDKKKLNGTIGLDRSISILSGGRRLKWEIIDLDFNENRVHRIHEALIRMKDEYLEAFKSEDVWMRGLGFKTIGYGLWEFEDFKIDKWFTAFNILPMTAITIWYGKEKWTEMGCDLPLAFAYFLEQNEAMLMKLPSEFRDHVVKVGLPPTLDPPAGGF